ncbi:hypothetical protein BGW80DRAFT_1210798 [Lactifluus volemus]|nr:hypothetical protein BGW80DRAFT_1210798 [Lactifluus volemus]
MPSCLTGRPAQWRRSTYPTRMRRLPCTRKVSEGTGRKGNAIESCFQKQGSRMIMERPDRAYSYADRQGFEVEMSKIWTVSGERDTFIGCLTAPAYHVTENEQYMKSQPIKLGVYKVMDLPHRPRSYNPCKYYEHLWQSGLMCC